jgi:pilus assembly protein FimV
MPRGLYRSLLILALSLPGAAGALGLGDIRVDSALNEPLSAQIDIVGATDEELIALRAAVASRETFQRYGAERAAFLSTASFKVTRGRDGQAILTVRSDQAVTDPLVTLLLDVNWGRGELIKEYSLLLDPAPAAAAARGP